MELSNTRTLKQDKGIAGLNIILSIVVFLFTIGFLIFVFSLMNEEVAEALEETTASSDVASGNLTFNNVTQTAFANATLLALEDLACSVYNVTNSSTDTSIGSGNYTVQGAGNCYIIETDAGDADSQVNNTGWNVSFAFTNSFDTVAGEIATNTSLALSGAVDWFDIIIVIGFMVVLILLVVLIITTMRNSGITGTGGAGGSSLSGASGRSSNIGSA